MTCRTIAAYRFVAAIGAALAPFASQVHAQSESAARIIVKFTRDSPLLREAPAPGKAQAADRAHKLGARLGLALEAGTPLSDSVQVVFAQGIDSDALARRLAVERDVEYAVPDERRHPLAAPNDPLYAAGIPGNGPVAGQWYLRAPTSDAASSLDAEAAWAVTTGSPRVVVAVVDTGVRFDHPDLPAVAAGGNLLPGYDMVADAAAASDGDGRDADATDPGDFVTEAELAHAGRPLPPCAGPRNSSWHGTKVAGLIAAATDNGIGIASVGRRVRVLPVRVLGKCGGFDSDIIAGMRWAAGLAVPGVPANPNRAQIINLSLGAPGICNAAYQSAVSEINAAGTVIVAAAGNSAGHAVGTPANCKGVIAVAALRHVGTKVGFSDLGPEIAISAPGGNCVNTAADAPCLYPIATTSDAGATGPAGPIYTDSFNPSVGTSFAAPLVAGAAALMLSAQPALSPSQTKDLLQASARRFPQTGGDNGDGTPVPQCTIPRYDSTGQPVDQLQCYCTTAVCGAGMLDAGAAVTAASLTPPGFQVGGLWWKAPAGSESGWGLNLAHQGDVVFATWFTYDAAGRAWWLSMTASRIAPDVYAGTLHETRGPALDAMPFRSADVVGTAVGTGTLAFSDAGNGTFSYTVRGVAQTRTITRQVFGALPSCVFAAQSDLSLATHYQDLWWNSPPGSESGWGINLTQQGNIIFGTWFTYDHDGAPLWLSVTATSAVPRTFSGTLHRSSGPPFDAVPFDPARVVATAVGTATFTFSDGNAATFAYTVNGVTQTKAITRQVFRSPGTVCR